MPTIDITQEDQQKIGSNYISGRIGQEIARGNLDASPAYITLNFIVKSYDWCVKNNGLDEIILTENTIPLLMEDLTRLVCGGWRFKITYTEINE